MSKQKDERLKKLTDEHLRTTCTFAPKISEPPESIKLRLQNETLFDREMKTSQSLRKLREKSMKDSQYDCQSQRPLFHPIIGKDSNNKFNRRRPDKTNIYNYLYGMKDFKTRREEHMLVVENNKTKESQAKSSMNSNKLLSEIQNQKLETVFEYFDIDGDGYAFFVE